MQEKFKLYKGLQRPLIFKIFRGKYIYWAAGSLAGSIFGAGIVSSTVNSLAGIITLIIVGVSTMSYTISEQKKGLHRKKKEYGQFVIQQKFNPRNERKKNI